ncbi:MAG TPA: hypothetical protein VL461_02965 [Dictyobacter sp.]|jgi:hypothetical protein|nr:hypothetical protein [Dictyobacter sp.]
MEFDEFLEPEVAATAAVAAVVFSPGARKLIRRGLVYGMAGALMAGDVVTSFAHSISRGLQQGDGAVASGAHRGAGASQENAQGSQNVEA